MATVPEIAGRAVFAGGAVTGVITAVGDELADWEPTLLVAVTSISSVEPTSAALAVYVSVVAPVIAERPTRACHSAPTDS